MGRCGKVNAMGSTRSYKDLDAWRLAMTLVETTYRVSQLFPDTERYGLVSQMRRCSVSIPSNIAEGQARGTVKFGLHFIRVAIGSTAELDTQTELARRLGFVTGQTTRELDGQLERVRQMLYGMRREHERRLSTAGAAVVSLLFFVIILTAAALFV